MKLIKKLRRRIRKKGLFGFKDNTLNAARRLWQNDFGMDLKEPHAKREGQMRARDREAKEDSRRFQVGEDVMTRQRYRAAVRRVRKGQAR